jgi:hypothetical protein
MNTWVFLSAYWDNVAGIFTQQPLFTPSYPNFIKSQNFTPFKLNKAKRQKETKIYLSRATFCNSKADFCEKAQKYPLKCTKTHRRHEVKAGLISFLPLKLKCFFNRFLYETTIQFYITQFFRMR